MNALGKKIRVLVVDDSIVARKTIIDALEASPRLEVVGYAINAMDAQRKVEQLNPDVMTCDVQMPGMTGIEFLKKLLPQHPLPVVLVSSLNLKVFDALHAGAVGCASPTGCRAGPPLWIRWWRQWWRLPAPGCAGLRPQRR